MSAVVALSDIELQVAAITLNCAFLVLYVIYTDYARVPDISVPLLNLTCSRWLNT
jgi:hypothetical protein